MESMALIDRRFWKGKRVLITGHTGFKGSWLSLWLSLLGAQVTGFALKPPTSPNFFETCRLDRRITSIVGDVRDYKHLSSVYDKYQPELVIHMAAQALVRQSYHDPVETYATNVMGTVNTLETARHCPHVRAILIITSDKCYKNREWPWGYREVDPMGGHDPYSSSKGCAELVTASFRNSFFPVALYSEHRVAVASARAGNVIGGGDWGKDRLVPDICKAVMDGYPLQVRHLEAVRPWQFVLDPLRGYIGLLERLYQDGAKFADGWNFGPDDGNCQPVSEILLKMKVLLGDRLVVEQDAAHHPHEARYLKLDCSKARQDLNWAPKMKLSTALAWTVKWYQAFAKGDDMAAISKKQIIQFEEIKC
jgi:CDP-glucose 4,6-dehydratase